MYKVGDLIRVDNEVIAIPFINKETFLSGVEIPHPAGSVDGTYEAEIL